MTIAAGFGVRVKCICDLYPSRAAAAASAGVTPDTLARYMREEIRPSFEAMVNLCALKEVSLEWLATGRGDIVRTTRRPLRRL